MIADLCKIREIQHIIAEFESGFSKKFGISLNEGMLLCTLAKPGTEKLSSGEICSILCLTHSNASKVIKSAENKKLIERNLGNSDKRRMYFILTPEGKKLIGDIKKVKFTIADISEN